MTKNMAKSISVIQKKRGRPATGVDPMLSLRLPAERIEAIDAWAEKEGVSRSEAIRLLIDRGLRSKR